MKTGLSHASLAYRDPDQNFGRILILSFKANVVWTRFFAHCVVSSIRGQIVVGQSEVFLFSIELFTNPDEGYNILVAKTYN